MSWGSPEFVIMIVLIATGGWIINNWIRARHGYALEDEWGGKTERAASLDAARLAEENRQLAERLAALEERTGVVEAIVTDSPFRLAGSIEALRDGDAAARDALSTRAPTRA